MIQSNLISHLYQFWLDSIFNHYVASSKKILKTIDIKPTDNVLDIGGGKGCIANLLRISTGAHIVVADPSETLIQKGKRKFSQIKYVQTSVEQLPFQDNSYDVVLMIGMLHFTSDPELALREAARVLKPGGTLLISDINFANPLNKFIIKPIKTAVISKVNSFSPEEIDTILLKYNFKSKRHTAADFVVSAVKY